MTWTEAMQAAGAAGIGGAVALLIRQAAHSLRNRSERYIADGEMAVGVLAEMRQLLNDAREDIERLEGRIGELEADVMRCRREREHLIRWAQSIAFEMKRRNLTPPEMPAVLMKMEDA